MLSEDDSSRRRLLSVYVSKTDILLAHAQVFLILGLLVVLAMISLWVSLPNEFSTSPFNSCLSVFTDLFSAATAAGLGLWTAFVVGSIVLFLIATHLKKALQNDYKNGFASQFMDECENTIRLVVLLLKPIAALALVAWMMQVAFKFS